MFELRTFLSNTACVLPDGSSYTYGDLAGMSVVLEAQMLPHTLVFCLCENNLESLLGYIASVENKNVVLLLDAHIETHAFVHLYEIYRPQYVWAPEDFVLDGVEKQYEFKSYRLFRTPYKREKVLPDELTVLLTTSGSTGSPKLVRLSEKNLECNARSIIEYLHLNEEERPVTSLPMYYSFGLSIINSHLLCGATLLLTNVSYVQREFWTFANQHGFTSFSGIPYTYEILKKLRFWTMKCPTLRTLTQAGGKLNNELLQYFIENGKACDVAFYLMYGQTEATARMSYLPPEYGLDKLGSIGKGIPGGEFCLKDDDDKVITEANVVGNLVYTGNNVSLGYAETNAALYKSDENHGILYTGDLAYRDADGFYFIAGRKKRFLKLFGNRISLDYIETLLKDYLNECVCVGSDDKLIIYTTDKEYDASQIIDFLVQRTKILRSVFFVKSIDGIPRSETGKIMYKELSI